MAYTDLWMNMGKGGSVKYLVTDETEDSVFWTSNFLHHEDNYHFVNRKKKFKTEGTTCMGASEY